MAVVIETTAGDIVVDLFLRERPRACLNFIKLCQLKYYNYNLFHTIQEGFIAQTGDPTGKGDGGSSVWGVIEGSSKRYFEAESVPKIRHTEPGLLSMVSAGDNLIGSQFFFTLGADLTSLDGIHCVIGEVTEGHEIVRKLNEAICDSNHRPYKDIRITHTVVLEDPFENPRGFIVPSRSPSPSKERLQGGRIAADEDIDDYEGKTEAEINELIAEKEAKARATILEIVGDIPDVDAAPPENVLFVCKLNPVTTEDDLMIIFSRFGKIVSAEVIRDRVTNDSLQYAFIEFDDKKSCEEAYFKMDNVLIDDRRIHVDFSQSVSKIKWQGKGRWTINDEKEPSKGGKNHRGREVKRNGNENKRDGFKDNNRRDWSRERNRRSKSSSRDRYRRQRDVDRHRSSNNDRSRDSYKQRRSRERDYKRSVNRSRSKSPRGRHERKDNNSSRRHKKTNETSAHRKRSRSVSFEDERRHKKSSKSDKKKKKKKNKKRSSSSSSSSA